LRGDDVIDSMLKERPRVPKGVVAAAAAAAISLRANMPDLKEVAMECDCWQSTLSLEEPRVQHLLVGIKSRGGKKSRRFLI
jgi:hypothetical protein